MSGKRNQHRPTWKRERERNIAREGVSSFESPADSPVFHPPFVVATTRQRPFFLFQRPYVKANSISVDVETTRYTRDKSKRRAWPVYSIPFVRVTFFFSLVESRSKRPYDQTHRACTFVHNINGNFNLLPRACRSSFHSDQ